MIISIILIIIVFIIILQRALYNGELTPANCSYQDIIIVADLSDPNIHKASTLLAEAFSARGYNVKVVNLTTANMHNMYCARLGIFIGHTTAAGDIVLADMSQDTSIIVNGVGHKIMDAGRFLNVFKYVDRWIVISCSNPGGSLLTLLKGDDKLLYNTGPISWIGSEVLRNVYEIAVSWLESSFYYITTSTG